MPLSRRSLLAAAAAGPVLAGVPLTLEGTASVSLPSAATTRYVRLLFTADTGWPAGPASEVQLYAS
jgi:hypothetical protein